MKKSKRTNVILVLLFLAGLSLLLYPDVSNYWNSLHATKLISDYVGQVTNLDREAYEEMYLEAVAYNKDLTANHNGSPLSDAQRTRYESVLSIGGSGVMGYIEIEKLRVNLPIYHGTDAAILQVAAGHIEWSSLPTGGESTHCVLSGHRGLPSAKLFTDLDQLHEGDTFMLHTLDEVLTYEVDQIRIVKPAEIQDLRIEDGKDYCTLVTCTPYGINTQRLLVRGHRVETVEMANVVSDAIIIEPLLVAPMIAFPMLLVLMAVVMVKKTGRKPRI